MSSMLLSVGSCIFFAFLKAQLLQALIPRVPFNFSAFMYLFYFERFRLRLGLLTNPYRCSSASFRSSKLFFKSLWREVRIHLLLDDSLSGLLCDLPLDVICDYFAIRFVIHFVIRQVALRIVLSLRFAADPFYLLFIFSLLFCIQECIL